LTPRPLPAPEALQPLAAAWADAGTLPPPGTDALALGRALKTICYEAWGRDPPRAARAAEALARLAVPSATAALARAEQREIQGLADWTRGIVCLTRGEMADAVAAFDAAAGALRDADQPDAAAQTQVPKIMALSLLGQHAAAVACAEAAQRELLALGNLPAAARVSQNLGVLHVRRDQYAEAARHHREAVVLFARLGDAGSSVIADIGLAGALTGSGDFDEAERIHARARMRAGHRGLALHLAQLDESEALLALARGRYRDALAGFESARRGYQALGLPQYLAIAEKQLGDAYLELRLLPEALALFTAAVARFAELALPDEQAWALAQRGRSEALLGLASSDVAFAQAAALFEQCGNRAGAAAVAFARGELALAGGAPETALAWAEEAAAGYAVAGQADGTAQAGVLRGQALLGAGRTAEAAEAFDAGLAAARRLGQTHVQVRCLTGQGLAAQAAGDARMASACFEAAIELFEDQRRALPGDEIRSAFLSDHLRPYTEQLRAALHGGDGAMVLRELDRCRARSLDERLAETATAGLAAGRADPIEGDVIAPLRERLNWLYRRVQRLNEDGDAAEALSQELRQRERELMEVARRQRLAAPGTAPGAAHAFNVGTLQAALRVADAVVAFGVVDDELFACVATARGVSLHRHVAEWGEVQAALRSVRFQLDALRHGSALMQQHLGVLTERLRRRLTALHALVWAPLAAALTAVERLLIVPHAQMAGLPFAALGDVASPGSRCLGEQFQLALAPSASAALRGLLRPPVAARVALALGESSRLPHTAPEAQRVASLFEQGRACVGPDATLAELQAHVATADVIHLACHAQFRSDNPRFSALHLADAALTVELTEALPLRAGTVVLSACETALAENSAGDEMVGLVRAFLVAGAARVVASQWPVDDAVTLGFMAHFYRGLAAGQGAAAALQAAQAATRSVHPHPCFWAAFTLFGGW